MWWESAISNVGEFLADARIMAVYWGLAIFGTVFFAFSCLLAFFGVGGLDSPDFDADGLSLDHPDTGFLDFKLFSLRSILAFLTVFGWGGVIWGHHGIGGFLGALFCGFVTMVVTAFLIWGVMKLQCSGNVSRAAFLGKNGTVYLGIPGGSSQAGKIVVSLHGATHEFQAVADEAIPTGTSVIILEQVDDKRFKVRKI
ncbi:MAG: hypothetical protein BWY31_01032 [Lentisphaerae bacterium ADurb.Bin242]|nr:MAG: hypothetical protein BWY31_01032 [Lentisphaerae bacterium ADurb.Bin242]